MSDPVPFEGATPRHALPQLFAGQAQKEFFVNEALLRADFMLHAAIEGEVAAPPAAPQPGQAWLIAAASSGAFAGRAGQIAGWSAGGWVFFTPGDGLRVFDRASASFRLFSGSWRRPVAPAAATGGTTVDAEARTTLVYLLERLVTAGVFAAS